MWRPGTGSTNIVNIKNPSNTCSLYLCPHGASRDRLKVTLGPDAVSYSSVLFPVTFARHDFFLRNQNPIQPTFKEVSMIQIKPF
jgi:hypothetical protein